MNSEESGHSLSGFGRGRGIIGLGDTNVPGLWIPGPTEHRELRRPHVPVQLNAAATMADTNESTGLDDITKTSNLSADAQEFYPRGYTPGGFSTSTQHVDQSLDAPPSYSSTIGYSPLLMNPMVSSGEWDGVQYIPSSMMPLHMQQGYYYDATQQEQLIMQQNESQTRNNITSWPPKNVTEQLRSAMTELTMNPGEFDNLVMPLGDTFCQWLAEPEVIQTAIALILEQSISEPNFRYNGARLCNLLNNLDVDGSAFRNMLLEKCRQENSQVREGNDPRRLHSFTLFLAELFIQLELKKGSGCKISVLGEGLFEDLNLLLATPTDDNVKCACQVLKLAGMHLEQEVSSASMDELENRITAAMETPGLAPNMRTLAQSVLNLRRHSWGRSPPSPAHPQWSSGQDAQPQPHHFLNEPVLYGPDGQMLTAEESRFLQDGLNAEDMGGSDAGSDEYDDGMDEELQAAYEQFLQMTPRST